VSASIAVSDMAGANEFYAETLGLPVVQTGADGSEIYGSGGNPSLHVYPSPARAGMSTAALAT
jgi:catechol-2,3-dioxygenase